MRIIAHLDMDAFFASLEERNSPHFKGRAIVVGADPKEGSGRGVVSTANYKARELGIHSALPISTAFNLAKAAKEEVVFLPPDFAVYQKSSENIYEIIKQYCHRVEQASIDEFYFDLSSAKTFKKAENICLQVKKDILEKEKVTCSVGLGKNKLISKIAASVKKPDGFLVVKRGEQFLEPLSVLKIPGIGPKTKQVLNKQGVFLIRDLKKVSLERLESLFGKWGKSMYFKARGVDNEDIVLEREVKSIGEQVTFEQDSSDFAFIGSELRKICKNVFLRFIHSNFKTFKTITLTVRFSGFQTINSSKTIEETRNIKVLELQALKLLLPFLDRRKNPRLKSFRLIGLRLERFHS